MNNPAINPAAACPTWCTATHEGDWLITRPNGEWNAQHENTPVVIAADEQTPRCISFAVSVSMEAFVCETASECHPPSVWVKSKDGYHSEDAFVLTARQALRLAEVLVQQASAVLAETSAGAAAVTR